MKIIRAGYTKFLNMFKTFVLTWWSYTQEKNTVRIDCHCHCHCQNGLEWPGMIHWTNLTGQFVVVQQYIRISAPCAERPGRSLGYLLYPSPYTKTLERVWFSTPSRLLCWPMFRVWINAILGQKGYLFDALKCNAKHGYLSRVGTHFLYLKTIWLMRSFCRKIGFYITFSSRDTKT